MISTTARIKYRIFANKSWKKVWKNPLQSLALNANTSIEGPAKTEAFTKLVCARSRQKALSRAEKNTKDLISKKSQSPRQSRHGKTKGNQHTVALGHKGATR
jgi:hypothetical protein